MSIQSLPTFRRAIVAFSTVLALALLPRVLSAQVFVGTWEVAVQGGNRITVVLAQTGRRVAGTLSGNGNTFAIEAEVDDDGGFYGTAKATGGSLFIGGERAGDVLTLALAELNAAGMPDLTRAQELQLSPATASSGVGPAPAPNAAAPTVAAPRSATPNATPAPGARSLGTTATDQQLVQLLTSSPWCYMRYSQQMGSTTTERVVFTADGRVSSGTNRESSVNNQYGSYYGNSNSGEQGFWRVENGALMLSADGRVYEATAISVAPNSNGYPIVTSGGKEYSQCR